jgi:hypothetical protein
MGVRLTGQGVGRGAVLLFAAAAPSLVWLGLGACAVEVSLGPAMSGGGGSGGVGGAVTTGGTTFDAGMLCQPTPDEDRDSDGFSITQGDCDDCDPLVNPNAVEVISLVPGTTPFDEDCDGLTDEVEPTCDGLLDLEDLDPVSAAMALDLCKMSNGPNDWGLVSARWTLPDGSDPDPPFMQLYHLGHGILPDFGFATTPRRGLRMLALSSGTARRPTDPGHWTFGGFPKGYPSAHPPGFPKESPSCPMVVTGEPQDAAAIELEVRTPSNARGIAYDFDFFTYEWPDFICSPFNDFFIALLYPQPPGQNDANISFDSQGNPVSVNNAFLDVCGCPGNPPMACLAGGKSFDCSLGDIELLSTGFGFDSSGQDHAATSWLFTEAPVDPNDTITLRLVIYDSSDGLFDSLVLIDNFRWIAKSAAVKTARVPK